MNEDQSYLIDLYKELEDHFENNDSVNFKIKAIKKSGFSVQVGGVFGFMAFNYMPWKYKEIVHWKSLSGWIINKVMQGRIETLDIDTENGVRITLLVDGTCHEFQDKPLTVGADYKCVVLQKTDYGLFVDLGFHDNFAYGSFVGLIHKSNLDYQEDFEKLKNGDIFETTFFGYAEDGFMVIGDNYTRLQWQLPEITSLVGTEQEAVVSIDENGWKTLFVLDKYQATPSFTEEYYGDQLQDANDYFESLVDEQIVRCEVIRVNRPRGGFKVKLLLE